MKKNVWVLGVWCVLACSPGVTTPPKAPLENLSLWMQKDPSLAAEDGQNQAGLYLAAKKLSAAGTHTLACQNYQRLSNVSSFPLRLLAELRSLTACGWDRATVEAWWENREEDYAGFLRREFLETSLEVAERVQSSAFVARFLVGLAAFENIPREREKMLQRALTLAQATGDAALVSSVRKALEKYFPTPQLISRGPREDQLYEAARNYERKRQYTEARKLYHQIIHMEDADMERRIAAYNRYAYSYKLELKRKQYLVELNAMRLWLADQVVRLTKEGDLLLDQWVDEWHKKWILYARALWTADQLDAGRNELLSLLQNPQGPPSNPHLLIDVHWLLANMSLAEEDYANALISFDRARRVRGASDRVYERVYWSLGWTHYLVGDYSKAAESWKEAQGTVPSLSFQRKVQFWRGKAHFLNNESARAASLWSELAEDDTFGYYGIVAHLEMQRPMAAIHAPAPSPGTSINTLDWLIYLEENRVAKDFLKSVQGNYRDTQEIVELLPYYPLAHWHEGGIFKFATLEGNHKGRVSKMLSRVVFPTPYREEIEAAAQKYALPVELIYAIARQESAFNPTARSPSDAFGLMQLLPTTAKKMGREGRIPYSDFEDLYDVATNVTLGSHLLRKLSNAFGGNFVSIVGSYNAGSANIRKWFKARYRKDPLEFIEMIPYRETRNYVKYVYRNYVIYQRLLGKDVVLEKGFFGSVSW